MNDSLLKRAAAIAIALVLLINAAPGVSQAQRLISYQGLVTDANNAPLTGSHAITIRIYAAETGGTSVYQETQTVTFSSQGTFDLLIGKVYTLPPLSVRNPATDRYYLSVQIDLSPELAPREPLSDVPSAFFADTAGYARTALYSDTAAYARAVDPSILNLVPTTVNGLSHAVTLTGGGSTTVSTSGDTISISSTALSAIKQLINTDGTMSILTPNGPVTTIGVGVITTANIADGSITTPKLADGAVSNAKLSSGAVTFDKVNSGASPSGQVLVANGSGGTVWQNLTAQTIALPYAGSASSSSSIFSLTNTGSGSALSTSASGTAIASTTSGVSGIAIQGTTSDGGAGTLPNSGVLGTSANGHGVCGLTNTGDGVYASASTMGVALHAVTSINATSALAGLFENLGANATGNVLEANSLGAGDAGYFQINNSSSVANAAIEATTNGRGSAGAFSATNSANNASALSASTNGSGASLSAITTGTGSAGTFTLNNSANGANALSAFTNGTGSAGLFQATNTASTASALEGSTGSASSSAMGIFGWASNTGGTGTGVYGQAEGQGATGVHGVANNTTGNGYGVYGETKGNGGNGAGLYGWASNASSGSYGVWGQAEGVGSDAVVGLANNSSGNGVGIFGWSKGSTGVGIYGQSDGTTSGTIGIYGVTTNTTATTGTFVGVQGNCYPPSANGYGVFGQVMNSGPGRGVYGLTTGTGTGVYGQSTGTGNGVFGTNSNASGYGVQGQNSSASGTGVIGLVSSTGFGVEGENLSTTGSGVLGLVASSGNAIWGQNQGSGNGVYGQATGTGIGVYGTTGSSTAYGVYGQNTSATGTGMLGLVASSAIAVWGQNQGTGYGVYGQVTGTANTVVGVRGDATATTATGTGVLARSNGTGNALVANYYGGSGSSSTTNSNIAIFQTNGVNKARIDLNGVGYFDGGTQNSGADVAEALIPVGARSEYEPGDVLVLSAAEPGHVAKCSSAYSNCVSGVYATKPGVLLTTENVDANITDHVPMGVIGIIPTKVSGENGPIAVGDLLVTSGTPGHAMKGDPDKLRFGNVLGKAMEPFNGKGTGVIKVLVGKY